MRLAIRCNASHGLGLGDLICGLVLAGAAREAGLEPWLIVNDDPAVARLMAGWDGPWHTVPSGLSPKEDALLLAGLLRNNPVDMLFVIRFDQDLHAYAALKAGPVPLLGCIDFWSAFPPEFDLAVNWDPTALDDYDFAAYSHTRFLLGPRYVLLKPEINGLAPRQSEPERPRRLLVTMGGTDVSHLTLPVLRALEECGDDWDLELIVGAGYRDHHQLAEFLDWTPLRVEVRENAADMGRLLNRADLVITAGGLTLFESLALGRPTLAVAAVPHQEPRCREFARRGAAVFLGCAGELKAANIAGEIDRLADAGFRRELHQRARSQVGTQGPALIAGKIAELMQPCLSAVSSA